MLLTELSGIAGDTDVKDWEFEVLKDGTNGGKRGETLTFDAFQSDGPYALTPQQVKQYFSKMDINDVRIIMAKSGNIKVARSK